MQISKIMQKRLVSELEYCADKIKKEREFNTKLFFLSNAVDSLRNIVDLEYDSQLILAELVMEVTTATISQRVKTNLLEKDTTVKITDAFFDKLSSYLSELAVAIAENLDTYKVLEKIVDLAHTTTSRGYYLYTKGSANE